MKRVVIDEKDNVGVELEEGGEIPAGHKFALRDIRRGEYVIKYGEIIGRATADIRAGEWVHTHNLKTHLDENGAYRYAFSADTLPHTRRTFWGYKRKNGRAGIRNEICILPTVGCVNGVCRKLEKAAQKYIRGSIDGIYALTHQFGCSQLGKDGENIRDLLCGIARNPNFSYVLIVGLGCENNTLAGIRERLEDRENIGYYNCRDVGDEIGFGLERLREYAEKAAALRREETDWSELRIGLKCGGSDGYSGLTANPLAGKIADEVVEADGGGVLTEIPEMFGAEQILMNRCADSGTYEKYRTLIESFKESYRRQDFPIYENPSPGNRAGGITTLEEKSLGCVRKAGRGEITDILEYGEQAERPGISVLNGPGNDPIAATALGASGCQLVLFTTGRGTPFSSFVPTLKIASNSRLAEEKKNWIDFDGYAGNEAELSELLQKTLDGEYRAKGETDKEIAFYKTGVTL